MGHGTIMLRRLPVRAALGSLAALACALTVPAIGQANPYIHAHRGGPLVDGAPAFGEETMPAFRNAARLAFVLELDVKLTADDVPVVIHDATLDRTTDCTGRVDELTLAQLRDCRVDVLGTAGNTAPAPAGERKPVPTLERVLRLIERKGAKANIEIKNVPTDPDFDGTPGFANTVLDAIEASDVPRADLIIQSFWPQDLVTVGERMPELPRSLLTLPEFNDGAPALAQAEEIEWVSPAWPENAAYVAEAHSLGRQIVPYTIDDEQEIAAAAAVGVDAIISNDPTTARRAVAGVVGERPAIPPRPNRGDCRASRAENRQRPAIARAGAKGAPRMFAMQFKQEVRHVETYETFRAKIECMIRRYVKQRRPSKRPSVVAFNEDIGLMTLATGSRGQAAREIFADPENAPECEEEGVPCGALGALEAVTAAYGSQVGAYQARFPGTGPLESGFLAPTDTLARGWMQVFSDMARRYDVHILGSNTQAPFRESRDPSEIAAFRDPDLPEPDSVFVATEGNVYNEVFMWGPEDVRSEGPWPLRNMVTSNRKVPLTELEQNLEVSAGPSTGPDAIANLHPYRVPRSKAKISFATSLPAFIFGHGIGEPPPGVDPCSDTSLYYMRCMDQLGANVVMQDEANPGRWAVTQPGGWQPLEWMSSSWRHVADRSVDFDYNVTPFMVGNLADIVFDGQTSIAQRGPTRTRGCSYVGTNRFRGGPPENDPDEYRRYAGNKRQFVGLAKWVSQGGGRNGLREVATKLAPGSGDALENDYLETAVIADLPFPVERRRRGCIRTR